VATKFGSNWLGATSSASGSSTIHTITPFCTQP
jgi:hypothetical protein